MKPNLIIKSLATLFIMITFVTPLHSQTNALAAQISAQNIDMPVQQVRGSICLIPAFHFNETVFVNVNFENISNATVVIKSEKGKKAKKFTLAEDEKYLVLYSHTLLPGYYICQLFDSNNLLEEINFKVLNR